MVAKGQVATIGTPPASRGKQLACEIFLKTMAALDIRQAMLSKLERQGESLTAGTLTVSVARPPRVIAFGKAAHRMASALDELLGGRIEAGLVVAPAPAPLKLERFRYFVGGHPYPTEGSLEGARAALELVSGLTPDDLVIFLVSGGGSALLEQPLDAGVTLTDLIAFHRVLVTGGLRIEEMNVLRKHLSAVKGGRLAARADPARQLTIYVSDVPEDKPSMVASGPTMPDESTVEECYRIAREHGLVEKLPDHIRRHFVNRTLAETPKPDDACFRRSQFFCLLSNHDAVRAARAAAEKLGFHGEIDPGPWDADFREVAENNLRALDALAARYPSEAVCLVAGGEVVCPVTGPGMGGRNQSFVLYAAERIAGQNRVVLSAGTDGRDGNSPASGAVADGQTASRARALHLDASRFLGESDAYNFFRALGDTIETGYTDNNVRDVRLWLHFPEPPAGGRR